MANEKTLKTLHDEVIAKATDVVDAMNAKLAHKVIDDKKKACKNAVTVYNEALARDYYVRLSKEHGKDAIKVALEAEETAIPNAISVTFKYNADDVAFYKETKPVMKVSLTAMQEAIGTQYFHSADWFARITTLAKLMAGTLNDDLGGSATFQYIADEAKEAFKLSEDADPRSVKSMTKAFQCVVDDILFIGDKTDSKGNPVNGLKFISNYWVYIREGMTSSGDKVGKINIRTPAGCSELVADTIHMLLHNKKPWLAANT